MSKPESGIELCKVPDTVKFKFVEEQEMHSSITIENLRDTIVSFKVLLPPYRLKPISLASTSSNLWMGKS